jgi:putative ABC transport system permease protein
MTEPERMPRLPAAILRILLPHAEREEVVSELDAEYRARARSSGRWPAWRWLWAQVLGSVPVLARSGWWRGWTGFEPRANRWRPGGALMEGWAKDVKYTARRLKRRPTFGALSILTLTLGVAGTAAVFSIVRGLLLEPLPVVAEEEVAVFWMEGSWSMAEFAFLRPQMEGFRSVAAFPEGGCDAGRRGRSGAAGERRCGDGGTLRGTGCSAGDGTRVPVRR